MSRPFDMRPVDDDEIEIVSGHGNAIDMAICRFEDGGHKWIEGTAIGDNQRSFVCQCGARGVLPRG